jgi:uncharacterized protein YcbK (DUF882 family)
MNGPTEHFIWEELICKCGCRESAEVRKNIFYLATLLERIRSVIGKPVIVTSAFRCAKHNAGIGGAGSSRHIRGQAADIKVIGMDGSALATVIEGLIKKGALPEGGLGTYENRVHYDFRGHRARWKK